MDYNEYDGNGNKRGFNFSDIMNDKTQRSRFFLFVYLVLFIILVIFVRTNLSNTVNNQKEEEKNNEEVNNEKPVEENKVNNELNEMFSFIDQNNYEFIYNISIKDSVSEITGKRYNNKYSFVLNSSDSVLYFNGTGNYIRAKDSLDGEAKVVGFPYMLINIFDNKVLKELIGSSTLNNDIYEISNKDIGKIVKENIQDEEKINTIELIKSNNKVVQINLNLSNVMSSYMKETVNASISLKYSNFGLVDDFEIE